MPSHLEQSLDEFYSEHSHMLQGRDLTPETFSAYISEYFLWRYILLFMLSKGEKLSQAKILDAGCGTGRAIMRLIEYGATPENCYGIDGAQASVDYCQAMFPKLNFSKGFISKTEYDNDSFDITICLGVMLHFLDNDDLEQAFLELYRIMKPGGLLFFTIPSKRITYPGSVSNMVRTFDVFNNEINPFYNKYFETINVYGYGKAGYDIPISDLAAYSKMEAAMVSGELPADYYVYTLCKRG